MVGDQEHSQEVLKILTFLLCYCHGGYFLQLLEQEYRDRPSFTVPV